MHAMRAYLLLKSLIVFILDAINCSEGAFS